MTVNLNSVAGALVGFLVIGDGATFTATSTSGDWPATTRLRVANHAGVETAYTPVIATTLATWTLTVAEVTALVGTKTSGQLSARITHGTGDALRGILAGPLTLISEWTGVRGTQSLGSVVVGPTGVSVASMEIDADPESETLGHLLVTLDNTAVLDAGPVSGLISHADLTSLQGGAVGERYHLTAAQLALVGTAVQRNPTLAAITRDSMGRIVSATIAGAVTTLTRDTSGRVATIAAAGATRTVTRDNMGRIEGIN